MNIITGYTGAAHVTAQQDRLINQAVFGTGTYILSVGSQLEPTINSATSVSLADGLVSLQGCIGEIPNGSTEEITIGAGATGYNRLDLICAKYTKDSNGIESIGFEVIQGVATTGTPEASYPTEGSIEDGDTEVYGVLYGVQIEGLTISRVRTFADIVPSTSGADAQITSIVNSLTNKAKILTFYDSDDYTSKIADVEQEAPFIFMGKGTFNFEMFGIGTGTSLTWGIGCRYSSTTINMLAASWNNLYFINIVNGNATVYNPLYLKQNV